jgi:hypothetical protein
MTRGVECWGPSRAEEEATALILFVHNPDPLSVTLMG